MLLRTQTTKTEVLHLGEVKVFVAQIDDAEDLERQVKKYMDENPTMKPDLMTMAAGDTRVVLTISFVATTVYMPMFIEKNRDCGGPFGPIGPAITKDGPNDDPWHGEFIPLGDPPVRNPVMTPYVS